MEFYSRISRVRYVLLVLGLLVPLLILRIVLFTEHRFPMGHNAFQYLQLQYVFFNEAAIHGKLPQWLPFIAEGFPSSFWITISEGVFALVLSPLAPFLRHFNFLGLFEAGLLFDECLLLVGSVLLARRHFKSPTTILFVAVAVTYTAVSSVQPWLDFHLSYLVPLILYCLDRVVRDRSVWHFFLTGLFGLATVLGNPTYLLAITGLAVGVFTFVTYSFARRAPNPAHNERSRRRFPWRYLSAAFVLLCFAVGIGLYVKSGLDHLTVIDPGRAANGEVDNAARFLTYGGYVGFGKFVELIGRYSNNLDNTVYGGLLVVPFGFVALARVRSRISYAFGITALLLASFSAGTLISLAFYYVFPGGRFFRHIGLTAPLAKMFLIFYSGFGFEAYLDLVRNCKEISWRNRPWRDKAAMLVPVVVIALTIVMVSAQRIGGYPIFHIPPWAAYTENQLYLSHEEVTSALARLLLLSLAFFVLLVSILMWPRVGLVLASAVLILHGLDVLWLKAELEYWRTPRVDRAVVDLFETSNYRFPVHRTQDYYSNERYRAIASTILQPSSLPFEGNTPYFSVGRYGDLYMSMESFLFVDSVASPFRTDFWLNSIDSFYRVWLPLSGTAPGHPGFPIPQSTTFRKLSGLGLPKLQVFSGIHVLNGDGAIAEVLANPDFQGDQIFVSPRDMPRSYEIEKLRNIVLHKSDRVNRASFVVREFTFDALRIHIENPSGKPGVLYYAQAWHPGWRASVDGKSTPVVRTNLGYQSLSIPPGDSEVVFQFGNWYSKLLLEWVVLLSFIILGGFAWLALIDLPAGNLIGSSQTSGTDRGSAREATAALLVVADVAHGTKEGGGTLTCRAETMMRAAVAFVATYFFWAAFSVHLLGDNLWAVVRLLDPTGLPLVPAAMTVFASLSSYLLGRFLKWIDFLVFVRWMAILGIALDALGFMLFGLDSVASRTWFSLDVAALVCIGLFCGSASRRVQLALWAGLAVAGYAWIGSTLNACYVPGEVVDVNYDRHRVADIVRVQRGRHEESFIMPQICNESLLGLLPRLVLEGYRDYNIVRYYGRYYGVLQSEGAFDPKKVRAHEYGRLFVANTADEVKKRLDASLERPPLLVIEGYKGFNVIFYAGEYFAIPQGEGPFDISRIRRNGYSRVLAGNSVTEVKQRVDNNLGR